MEVLRHVRDIDPQNRNQIDNFFTYLGDLSAKYLRQYDIFVSIEGKDMVILKRLKLSYFTVDVIYRCLYVHTSPFEFTCIVEVIA